MRNVKIIEISKQRKENGDFQFFMCVFIRDIEFLWVFFFLKVHKVKSKVFPPFPLIIPLHSS